MSRKRDWKTASARLASDTAAAINHGGETAVWFWKAGWSLVEALCSLAAAGAGWMRRRPDVHRQRSAELKRRLRERNARPIPFRDGPRSSPIRKFTYLLLARIREFGKVRT
jgi:hypothetical protein